MLTIIVFEFKCSQKSDGEKRDKMRQDFRASAEPTGAARLCPVLIRRFFSRFALSDTQDPRHLQLDDGRSGFCLEHIKTRNSLILIDSFKDL